MQAGVKFGLHQVTLLKKVVMVLEPFFRATLQLSHDSSCISEVGSLPSLCWCFLLAFFHSLLRKLNFFFMVFLDF